MVAVGGERLLRMSVSGVGDEGFLERLMGVGLGSLMTIAVS